MNGVNWSTLYC